jgi:hypothetical protein
MQTPGAAGYRDGDAMPSPLGHTIFGYSLARELGYSRRRSLLAATFAMLPDIDMPLGMARKGDLFVYHRAGTHTVPFALLSGLAASRVHRLLRPADPPSAAAATGLLIEVGVASHLVADSVEWPSFNRDEALTHTRVFDDLRKTLRWELLNMALEAVIFGIPALYLGWRRAARKVAK